MQTSKCSLKFTAFHRQFCFRNPPCAQNRFCGHLVALPPLNQWNWVLDCFYSERTGADYANQSATVFINTNQGSQVLNRRDQRVFFLSTTALGFDITASPLIEITPKEKKTSATQGSRHSRHQSLGSTKALGNLDSRAFSRALLRWSSVSTGVENSSRWIFTDNHFAFGE